MTVNDTQKSDGVYIHMCTVANGDIKVGDMVRMEINSPRRAAIKRNHSACHLLQAALREVLGNHVEQAGSYVDNERLRFDFKHYAAMTEKEILAVESLVNAHISLGENVNTEEMPIEQALKIGAMALFGEKYGQTVRVVRMGNFSTELCGGTHIDNTAKAGVFKIISETSVAAGVRRIEATTGLGVLGLLDEKDRIIRETAKELKVAGGADVVRKAAGLMNQLKEAEKEIERLNAKIASSMQGAIKDSAVEIKGVRFMSGTLSGTTVETARKLADEFRSDDFAVTLIAVTDSGKISFAASCGKEAVKKGAHAGNIVKAAATVCGGNGGGRPDSAQSGGKQPENAEKALKAAKEALENMLK